MQSYSSYSHSHSQTAYQSSPSSSHYPYTPVMPELQNQNIDDIIYRYSAEHDRGTPTVGIYAQDGLWDEDEPASDHATIRPSSTSTFGHPTKRQSVKVVNTGRSRSGTVSSVNAKEDKPKMWTWGRKSNPNTPAMPDVDILPDHRVQVLSNDVSQQERTLGKKKSKSKLRGKGRRGELCVNVGSGEDESFEAPPPLPPTPASFLTLSSPALSTSSMVSPMSYPSRSNINPESSPLATTSTPQEKSKSSWKRGMQKIFKSKSSVALREAFSSLDPNRPPMPDNLPKSQNHQLGKPFSSSTPPMPSRPPLQRDTIWSFYENPLSPPPTIESFGMTSHPSLPLDPFASSLDLSSNRLPASPTSSPLASPKPRLSRGNSPSLRDLKNLLNPTKPKLTKAKSLANIGQHAKSPMSAPSSQPTFSDVPTAPTRVPKRVASAALLSSKAREQAGSPIKEEPLTPPPLDRPQMMRMPTESPPLLPPNPPYFPSSSSLPSRSTSATTSSSTSLAMSLTIDTSGFSATSPPSAPLPSLPSSSPLSPTSPPPIARSASGAVLLPRSRSTSMSLKAPPTSSSFFDLYEQLGIWPTPAEKEADKENERKASEPSVADVESQPEGPAPAPAKGTTAAVVSESPSATFSSGSWEAAISAFPLVDELPSRNTIGETSFDFGLPYVSDPEDMENLDMGMPPSFDNEMEHEIDEADTTMTSNIAVGGSMCSLHSAGNHSSNRTSTARPAASTSAAAGPSRPSTTLVGLGLGSRRSSRRAAGSNDTSNAGSRDEQRRQQGGWLDGQSGQSSGSSSEEEEEDDVPLSQLHPQAAAIQKDKARLRAARKADKARASGRNPGGDSGWDGEGGVPAEALSRKLEAALLDRKERVHLWQAVAATRAAAASGEMGTRAQPTSAGRPRTAGEQYQRPQRSMTDPNAANLEAPSVQRSQTVIRKSDERDLGRSTVPMPSALSPVIPGVGRSTSPTVKQGTLPDREESTSLRCNQSNHSSRVATGPVDAPGSSSSHHSHRLPPVPNVTRNNTTVTRTSTSRSRSRALSSASARLRPDENPHVRSVTEPIPHRDRFMIRANAFIGGLDGTRIVLDIFPDTTAKDILAASYARGELAEPTRDTAWVITEVFAELGYERQIREYEALDAIVKGWDQAGRFNCFLLQQSNKASQTWTRSIPVNAPFLGAYVQYESKRGKWSKRFLETRGGQVFLSKNDKNKEEIQINSLFHDVYTITRPYGAPKTFIFAMKRVEAASSFENPSDYVHIFSTEESTGLKLIAAVYDAKSHALAQAQPQLLLNQAQVQRRPTTKDGPLVDMKEKQTEKISGFTGKGLLRI